MKDLQSSKHSCLSGVARIATAIGAVAVGAFAIGALAIQWLAIRRVLIESAEFKSLAIQDLTVTRLHVADVTVSHSLELPGSGADRKRPSRKKAARNAEKPKTSKEDNNESSG